MNRAFRSDVASFSRKSITMTDVPVIHPTTGPVELAPSALADLVVEDVHVDLPSPRARPPVSTSPRSSFFAVSPNKGDIPLRILVGSWNVGNAMPPKSKDLINKWIPEGGGGFDVIAIGLQESSYREKSSSGAVSDGASPPKSRASRSPSKAASVDNGGEETDGDLDEDDGDDCGDEDDAGDDADGTEDVTTPPGSEVPVKRSRATRSMRKVSKIMRQVSTNLRESVADALDYPFNRQLFMHLGDKYALVGKVELLEMRLFVYVHTKHSVGGIEKNTVATGLGSVIGNKGGLIFKMVVRNTSLCFVSCHLAAHQDQKFLDKRNADCASILGGSGVGVKHVQPDFQFDHCFWFGDLNYRVDLNYSAFSGKTGVEVTHEQHFRDVLALVKAKKWTVLNANDQLRHQIQDKKALVGWELVPALFPPTFKRQRNTLDEYNPQRVPSYCDRVLHKSLPALRPNLQCLSFQCVEAIVSSDHKPVVAHFQVLSTPRQTTLTEEENAASGAAQKSALSRTTTVEFRELEAKDLLGMDLTGKSDPYIKFYSLPEHVLQRDSSGSHPSTATIMHTLSPRWQDDQVPKLSLVCDCGADARRVHLLLLLMDYDTTSMDDMLGNAVVSLDKVCHSSRPRFTPFVAPVVRHGKPAGTVSGKIRVLLPHQQGMANSDGATDEVVLRMAGCNCSIS